MSNGSSNTLPWVIALLGCVVGAGAAGFVGGRYSAPEPVVPAAAPQQTAQAQQNQQDPNALPPGTTAEPSGDWTLVCQDLKSGEKSCAAIQGVTNDKKQLVMRIVATYDIKAEKILILNMPLGIDIAAGVDFTLPGKQKSNFAFTTCTQISCDAVLTIQPDGYGLMDQAGSFQLGYTGPDGKQVPVTVSMKGLTDAYTKIAKPTPTPAAAVEGATGTPETNGAAPAPAPDTTPPAATPKPTKPAKPKPNGG